jgi:hypothetical protein
MLFSNQSLTFPKFFEPLNHYDRLKVELLGQGPKRTSQDETLRYQIFSI